VGYECDRLYRQTAKNGTHGIGRSYNWTRTNRSRVQEIKNELANSTKLQLNFTLEQAVMGQM
jgi:hypothetical protein